MHIGLVAGGVALLFFYSRLNEQREKRGRRSTGRGLPRQGDTTAAGPLVGGRRRVEGSHGRQGGGLSVLDGVQWLNAKVLAQIPQLKLNQDPASLSV